LRVGINAKGQAATTATTGIAFGTGIEATAAEAGGRVDNELGRIRMIAEGKGRDADVAIFLNGTQVRATALDKGFLPAAATLAAAHGATIGAFDRQDFRFCIELLDFHDKAVSIKSEIKSVSEGRARDEHNNNHHGKNKQTSRATTNLRMTRLATPTTHTRGFLERMRHLRLIIARADKVLEFSPGFAAHELLEPALAGLPDFHARRSAQVRLAGVAAAVHLLCHGGSR
jgi:hypothetical protein